MFRNLVASAGTEYMLGALYDKVSTDATKALGALPIEVQESEEPRRVGRDISFMCSSVFKRLCCQIGVYFRPAVFTLPTFSGPTLGILASGPNEPSSLCSPVTHCQAGAEAGGL